MNSIPRLALIALCASVLISAKPLEVKVLGFYNLHTDESVRLPYRVDGKLQPLNLQKISYVLRDHRRDEATEFDPALFDLLHSLREQVSSDANYQVISAYRSAATNESLKAAGRQVAQKSLHIKGQAIDIRLPGVSLKTLHKEAKKLQRGGVGLYVENDFIHVDTGRVRYW